MRVFVNVPQIYAPDAKNGVIATLTLPQYPGRKFEGKLVRTSNAVDPATRTLLAEIDVKNPSGELLARQLYGGSSPHSRAVPSLDRPCQRTDSGARWPACRTVDANSIAHLTRVTPGRDLGTTVEILTGLQPGQGVIANPPDSLTDGEKVRVMTPNHSAGENQ